MLHWIEKGLAASRRGFLKGMSVTAGMMILGIRGTSKAYAQAKDYLTSRIDSTYRRDESMKYRKSQDNPSVQRLYREYMEHPMSEKSEKYLHAVYKDRSAGVKGL
ncbi:MAG: iron hydrogenase small subunit [Candidatus Latescibacterota bacterium]